MTACYIFVGVSLATSIYFAATFVFVERYFNKELFARAGHRRRARPPSSSYQRTNKSSLSYNKGAATTTEQQQQMQLQQQHRFYSTSTEKKTIFRYGTILQGPLEGPAHQAIIYGQGIRRQGPEIGIGLQEGVTGGASL